MKALLAFVPVLLQFVVAEPIMIAVEVSTEDTRSDATAVESAAADSMDVIPEQSFELLAGLFYGREFVATQISTHNNPARDNSTEVVDVHVRTCADAVVMRCYRVAQASPERKAAGFADAETRAEYRWFRGRTQWETRLLSAQPFAWPAHPFQLPSTAGLKVVRLETADEPWWGPGTMIISDLASSLDHTTIRFAEMCSDAGRWGFHQEGPAVVLGDGNVSRYVYQSSDYGRLEATFERIEGTWLPVRAKLTRNATDKMVPDGLFPFLGGNNRVGNYRTFSQFTRKNATLDRMEISFDLSYDSQTSSVFPRTIERTDHWYAGSETASMVTRLSIDNVEPEAVSCSSVLAFALEIPNGTPAVVSPSESRNLRWTVRDGEVVKDVNEQTLTQASLADFTTDSGGMYIVAVNVIVGGLLLLTWWGHSRYKA